MNENELSQLVEDTKFVRYVIDRCTKVHQYYEMLEEPWSYDHNVYCVFHDNHDTPSARLYQNADGTTTMWCFSEQKMYRPSDFIVKELVNFRLESIFYKIWKQLDRASQERLMTDYGDSLDFIPQKFKDALPKLEEFKTQKISLSEFRKNLIIAIM